MKKIYQILVSLIFIVGICVLVAGISGFQWVSNCKDIKSEACLSYGGYRFKESDRLSIVVGSALTLVALMLRKRPFFILEK